jgi:hypothetical protein
MPRETRYAEITAGGVQYRAYSETITETHNGRIEALHTSVRFERRMPGFFSFEIVEAVEIPNKHHRRLLRSLDNAEPIEF